MYIDHTAGGLPVKRSNFSLPTRSKDSAERMLKENRGLVAKATFRIRQQFPSDSDDLLQKGHLALLAAHRDFDQTKGAGFRTFARHRLRGVVTSYFREQKRHSRCNSLFEEVDMGTTGEKCPLIDVVVGEYPPADRALNLDIDAAKPLLPWISFKTAQKAGGSNSADLLGRSLSLSNCKPDRVH